MRFCGDLFLHRRLLLLTFLALYVPRSVIADDVYSGFESPFSPGTWGPNSIAASSEHYGAAVMSMSIDLQLVLRPTGYSLGIPGYWFIVPEGSVFDSTYVTTHSQFSRFQATPNEPFIFGVYLESSFLPAPPFTFRSTDNFGWARMEIMFPGGLTLLDNAIARNGLGIIAGTATVVPEPASAALIAVGGLGVAALARLGRQRL